MGQLEKTSVTFPQASTQDVFVKPRLREHPNEFMKVELLMRLETLTLGDKKSKSMIALYRSAAVSPGKILAIAGKLITT